MSTINLTAPRNYGEMNEKQLRYVAALKVAGFPEKEIWKKCFLRFANIKPTIHIGDTYYFIRPKVKGSFTLTIYEVAFFSKKMNFLTTRYMGIKPLPRIGRYTACESLLRDTNFVQYLEAENHYQAFLFTKNEQYLYKLMGTLYQNGKKYNNNLTAGLAKYFARKASEEEKIIVLMWMIGIKEYFARKFKFLFIRKKGAEEDDGTPPDMYEIMKNQIRMLTKGDVTKEANVLKSPTWSALGELDAKCEELERLPTKK